MTLLNRLLSSVASSPPTPQSLRERLLQLAVVIAERYKGCGHSAPQSISHTFFLLLDIITFFDHYHNKRPEQALEVVCVCVCVCYNVYCYCVCYNIHNDMDC